jgi:hypothetical protein
MNLEDIKELINCSHECPSKWELENIIWAEKDSDPKVLFEFLKRIDFLNSLEIKNRSHEIELQRLLEIAQGLDKDVARILLEKHEDREKDLFIEKLARTSAIEVLTNNKLSYDTMNIACKLPPNEFILCAKRTQDIINSVRELVIKGENLSSDIPGA